MTPTCPKHQGNLKMLARGKKGLELQERTHRNVEYAPFVFASVLQTFGVRWFTWLVTAAGADSKIYASHDFLYAWPTCSGTVHICGVLAHSTLHIYNPFPDLDQHCVHPLGPIWILPLLWSLPWSQLTAFLWVLSVTALISVFFSVIVAYSICPAGIWSEKC